MQLSESTIEERFGKCPYATAQSLISGKWAVLILHYLEDGPIRFNELQRLMPKMTHATLSAQLKSLGNTAQRLCTDCEVRFFVRLYENDAGILAYSKEFSCKMTENMQARRTQSR